MTAHLFIEQGPRSGEKIVLDSPLIVAGRDPECELRLPDTFISRRQFRIATESTAHFLENLAPHNTTLLNGDEESGRVLLQHDDVIQVGATRIRFRAEAPIAEPPICEIVGSSWQTERVRARVEPIASKTTPVLIRGDRGTGKSVVARAIHAASPHRERPLVTVSCGAPAPIPEGEGMLFFDEVSELTAEGQAKLLASLDAGVRIVASTSRELASYHDDIATRLSVSAIELTPLVARKDDIPDLVRFFLARYEPALGALTLTPAAVEKLRAHAWPGNVRELRDATLRAAVFSTVAELGPEAIELDPTIGAEAGRERIERALAVTRGNHRAAAAALRISRSSLLEHLQRYALA